MIPMTRTTRWATHTGIGRTQRPTDPDRANERRGPRASTYEIRVEAISDRTADPSGHNLHRTIRAWWGPDVKQLGPSTCEDIALNLLASLQDAKLPVLSVAVSTAGEVGATVWAQP